MQQQKTCLCDRKAFAKSIRKLQKAWLTMIKSYLSHQQDMSDAHLNALSKIQHDWVDQYHLTHTFVTKSQKM